MSAPADVLESVLDKIPTARKEGAQWMGFCPAHADGESSGRRSLSIKEGERGIVFHCFAGCTNADIVAALHMRMSDLFYAPPEAAQAEPEGQRVIAEYVYRDESSQPLYKVVRYANPKSFTQHRWTGREWATTLGSVQRVLYRLPETVDAIRSGSCVYVVEGEKDCDTLAALGLAATSTPAGAGNLKVEWLAPLKNAREVVVIPDNDDEGRKYAKRVADAVKAMNPSILVKIVELDVEAKGDVSDYLATRPLKALHNSITQTPEYDPTAVPISMDYDDYCLVNEKTGVRTFQPSRLGGALKDRYDIVPASDGLLYRYQRGVYVGRGIELARTEAARILGVEYRQKKVDEVISWLRDHANVTMNGASDRARYINVRNGLLDWQTGELLKHNPSHFTTVQLPVTYDPDATCPSIDAFLDRFSPSADFMHEVCGLLTIPYTDLRKAFMLHGPTGTGKSTFLDMVRALVGRENVTTLSLHELSESPFSLSALDGKLANIFPDLDARGVERSSAFKVLTGGRDMIPAQRKFGPHYDYPPTTRLIFSANEMPGSRDQTDAWYERWVIVPFTRKPDAGEYDPNISDRLTTPGEMSGLLNHAVLGLRRLMQRKGFDLPDVVQDSKDEYQLANDTVKGFAEPGEGVNYKPHARVKRDALYQGYVEYCKRNGRHPLPQGRFTPKFRDEAGDAVQDYKSGNNRGFEGVELAA